MEKLHEFYSSTLLKPLSFNEFEKAFNPKWRQAYQVGIIEPKKQLALILYHHKPSGAYDLGFENGLKLTLAVLSGQTPEGLKKPREDDEIDDAAKRTIAALKGQITKLKKQLEEK